MVFLTQILYAWIKKSKGCLINRNVSHDILLQMAYHKIFQLTSTEITQSCLLPLHPKALDGIRLYNEGKYWYAHEALEDAWHAEPDPGRWLYQGILQAGFLYFHAKRGNAKGVFTMYERCRVWLWPWPDQYRSINVGKLKSDIELLVTSIVSLGHDHISELEPSLFTKIERV